MNTISFSNPTGANPGIAVQGDSPNIDITLTTKGNGVVVMPAIALIGGFRDSTGNLGTDGQVLTSNGTGTEWETGVGGTVTPDEGGTGITSYAIGDLLYASATTTLSKLADVAAGSFLRSGGVATAPAWSVTLWPNTATPGDLIYASLGNTYANLAAVATTNVLLSGGVGIAPAWGKVALAATTGIAGSGANTDITSLAGTATNDSAAAGKVGEVISSLVPVGSPVTLTTNTGANVTSISLTAGDWDVEGNVNFALASATATAFSAGITTTTETVPVDGSECFSGVVTTVLSVTNGITMPMKRISLSETTTVYLVGKSTFSAGDMTAFGSITARRRR